MTPHNHYKMPCWIDYRNEMKIGIAVALCFILNAGCTPDHPDYISTTLILVKVKKKHEEDMDLEDVIEPSTTELKVPYSKRMASFFHKRDSTRKAEGKEPCPQFQTLSLSN